MTFESEDSEKIVRQTAYEQAVEQARAEIEEHVNDLGPYDFQRLVAELLTAMGYHVPFIAPPGRDGGIDIVAYKDPLGTSSPRIRVQVKHREQKLTVKEVRELEGLLRKEGDIGLIVSSSGFTSEVEREIRASSKHIETMDLDRLILLWQQYYDNIRESGKTLLPLVKLYFLTPSEE
jgi:restriction system protein